MSSCSWSSYQGSCRDDDSVSSLQARVTAHCTVCGGMLTHTDICCWSAHFRGCCCHSIAGSISPVTCVTCVAPATGAPLLPGPAACAARRARPHWTPAQPAPAPAWPHQRSFFRSSYNLVCVYTQTIHSSALCVETVECLVFVWRAAPPSILALFVISVNIAVDSVGWAAAHRKLETILCDICPSPRQPRVPI